MHVVTFSELRKNLKSCMDRTAVDFEPLYIHRPKGDDIVMLNKQSYDALKETAYLLSQEANAKHLRKSIKEKKQGKLTAKTLKELLST